MLPHQSESLTRTTTVIKEEQTSDDEELNPSAIKVEVKLEVEDEDQKEEEVIFQPPPLSNRNEIEPELLELKYEVKEENWEDESEQNPIETTKTKTTINPTATPATTTMRLSRLQRVPLTLSLSTFDPTASTSASHNQNEKSLGSNKKINNNNNNNINDDSGVGKMNSKKSIDSLTGALAVQRACMMSRACPKCGIVLVSQRYWTLHHKECRKRYSQKTQLALPNLIKTPKSPATLSTSTTNSTATTSGSSRTTRIGNLQAVFMNGQTHFIPVSDKKDCDSNKEGNCDEAQVKSHQILDKEFLCHLCDFKTDQPHLLTLHRPVHVKKRRWRCKEPDCEYACAVKINLDRHMFNVHGQRGYTKIYSCSVCSYESPVQCHFNRHNDTVHKHLKKFSCSLCSYKASSKWHIKVHTKRHSNFKSFKCPKAECEYEARTKTGLRLHKKEHKKGEAGMKTTIEQNNPPSSSSSVSLPPPPATEINTDDEKL